MEQIQLPEPQLQPPEIAAAVSNVQDKADISLRNQLDSPLLQLPPEVRNEICKLAVLSTYEDGLISFDTLGVIEAEHRLPWTRVCKQLWTETRMLPFAMCAFSFGTGRDYAFFVGATSAEQRDGLRHLKLELLCEGGEMGWVTEILDEVDDCDGDEDGEKSDNETETGDEVETRFKSAFPNLQRLSIDIYYVDRRDTAFIKRWVAGLKRVNKGVTLRVKKGMRW